MACDELYSHLLVRSRFDDNKDDNISHQEVKGGALLVRCSRGCDVTLLVQIINAD